jgi:UDP-N-acetylmuramate--alanine ligase
MKIHLIGIGGIGVSALAQYYLSKGNQVSGSDLVASEITDFLKEKGIKVYIGNSAENIKKDFDLVVYSPAVKKNNPELVQAKSYKLKAISYPEALGDLTKGYYTIAVAGAHGKSTTTAMIALVLIEAGFDPTVIVGTKLKEFGNSNFRAGKSKFLVIEACEYDSSFLHYSPKIIVVTNVDKEHLDYFKTFTNVKKAFKDFILKLSADGFLIFNKDDKYIPRISKPKFKTMGFSLKQKETQKIKTTLKVPGLHNVSNALAALQVARALGISDKTSFKALSEFKGTWRRFEIKEGEAGGKQIIIVSDYAHHPNEISATLKAAREKYPNKKIWCVFQPHQHQRTYYLFSDFVKTFRSAPVNKIIITDIYDVAGREVKEINKEISSKKLVKEIDREFIIYSSLVELESHIEKNIRSGDVLIIMGAGDIYKLVDKF